MGTRDTSSASAAATDASAGAGRPAEIGGGWRALLAILGRLPQGLLSRAFGRIADLRLPRPLRRPLLGLFVRAVGVDMTEADGELGDYPSLNALFVRTLRAGVRSWPTDDGVFASPVDGVLGQMGRVRDGLLVQAKGREYRLAELLGDPVEADRFVDGVFVTLYLSPRHYHRIHSPCGGRVGRARHVPGSLLPVNPPAVALVPDLFVRNERLVCHLEAPPGEVAVVAIGAYNVGRISAAFDPSWARELRSPAVTNRRGAGVGSRSYRPPVPVAMGDEIMAFHMGSSVVMLLPAGSVLEAGLVSGREIRLGEPVARRRAPSPE